MTTVSTRAGGVPPLLPAGANAFLRRAFRRTTGAALLGGVVLGVAAIFSYAPGDPSLNSATGNAPENLLGHAGATLADLVLQVIGYGAAIPLLVLAVWGWRLSHGLNVARPLLRGIAALFAIALCTIALAAMNAPGHWPFMAGLGGVAGDLLLGGTTRALAQWQLPLTVATADIGVGATILAALALVIALGMSLTDWKTSVSTIVRAAGMAATGCVRAGAWVAGQVNRRGVKIDTGPVDESDVGDMKEADELDAAPPAAAKLPRATSGIVETKPKRFKTGKKAASRRQARLPLEPGDEHGPPPLELLSMPEKDARLQTRNDDALQQNAAYLGTVLEEYGVRGEIVKVRPGPVVTLYELEPAPGIKTSRVIGLADDIARSMSSVSVRVAVVPGRNVIGIELPNQHREMVRLRELLASDAFEKTKADLPLALGKDIGGAPVTVDLARMPHLLIAGTTGSGKSVAMNTMILSLLFNLGPERCKFIMIDPKMLELSVYEGIPHLLTPVVTDPSKAVVALKWVVREMEDRYRAMSQLGVRNIAGYNARLGQARDKGEVLTRAVQTGFDDDGKPVMEEQPLATEDLPYIVVVVDEMADLMLVAGKDVEAAIQRLAQMARAAGIHLMMATQRPSVDVITGTIKANFPSRISFQVTSKIDSRTILGEQGAEQLLGQGDMLYMAGGGRISRVHGPFVTDEEVEQVVAYLKAQGEPDYLEAVTEETADPMAEIGGGSGGSPDDQLYDEAVALVAREGKASTSFIQRHLQIGYNRAARIIERMEAQGVVTAANRVGRREVLIGNH